MIDEEKNKDHRWKEKRPALRFVERIEPIESNALSDIPSRFSSNLTDDRRRVDLIQLQNYLRGLVVRSKVRFFLSSLHFNEREFQLDEVRRIRGDLLEELRREVPDDSQLISPTIGVQTDDLESTTVAEMLDFLSKELVRLRCEQTIDLFISLADRDRAERERKETSRREQQVSRISSLETIESIPDVDRYLEDLVLQSISDTADEETRNEIQLLLEGDFHVSDLVDRFLFPLVHRLLSMK